MNARGTGAASAGGVHTVGALVEAARSAWPGLLADADVADFASYLTTRVDNGALPAVERAGDLLLAWACARGTPAAVAAFRRAHEETIARVLARRGADAALADEAAQTVYERLLVGRPGAPPKIAEYRGSGPLRSWVATATATTILMAFRAADRRREEPDSMVAAVEQASPELLYMKERYKTEVADAIVRALGELPERDRALLRLNLGENLSVDRIGAIYRVNRATAARWLVAAREALVAGARRAIRERVGLTDSECDSLAALIQSELHVSIARHLG